jgi:Spy/CpxP family protein refolding chaperone
VNHRFNAIFKTQLSLAALGVTLAAAVSGCGGSTANSGGAASQQDAGGSVSAGTGPGAAAGGRHMMAQALMGLGLSDDQKAQIRDIMRAARKESVGADPATRRANYKAAFAKIDTVLTPDQRVRLQTKLAELRKERQQGAVPQS